MRLVRRYIVRESMKATALALLALTTLYSFFDVLTEFKDIQGTSRVLRAFIVVALNVPSRIYELYPIAVLIGCLYALSTLARHSEMTVLRASGLQTRRLLGLLCQFALISGCVAMLFGEAIAPHSERLIQQFKLQDIGRSGEYRLSSGFWIKDDRRFINVERIEGDNTIAEVRIWQFDPQNRLTDLIAAKSASVLSAQHWQLNEVTHTHFDDNRLTREQRHVLDWQVAVPVYLLQMLTLPPERMSMPNLVQYITHLQKNQQKILRERIIFWKRLLYPLAVMVMAALALPFSYTHHRMSPVSLKIFFGVMIGASFYLVNGLFSSLGIINAWPTWISAAAPSLLFLSAALMMIWWAERR